MSLIHYSAVSYFRKFERRFYIKLTNSLVSAMRYFNKDVFFSHDRNFYYYNKQTLDKMKLRFHRLMIWSEKGLGFST